MKQTISLHDFRKAFQSIRPDNFSYAGLEALYDFLEETDPDYELDVIALCCDFTEYSSLEEFQADYENIDDIERRTTVIPFGDSFIIQNF